MKSKRKPGRPRGRHPQTPLSLILGAMRLMDSVWSSIDRRARREFEAEERARAERQRAA